MSMINLRYEADHVTFFYYQSNNYICCFVLFFFVMSSFDKLLAWIYFQAEHRGQGCLICCILVQLAGTEE